MNPYKNVSNPESTINNKHNSINYHVYCEAVAAVIMLLGKEDTHANWADSFTKLVPYSNKHGLLVGILCDC